jgi:glycolate dehydrogenase FAD-binding subunit
MIEIRPSTIEAVAEALRDAGARGLRVMTAGGGTHVAWRRPSEADVCLHTHALDRVVAHEADDMTIAVQAGMRAGRLASLLASHRCRLPLDVEQPDAATIGGMVAVGYSGPRRLGCGTLREHLIGARAVLGDGTVIKTGGMVVKNVSGYDVTRLLHGSLGSLAVIVELNFKLRPMPAVERALAFEMRAPEHALEAAAVLVRSGLPFAALHACSDGALVVGCEGHRLDVERLASSATDVAASLGGVERESATGPDGTATLWRRLLLAGDATDAVGFRIVSRPSQAGDVAASASALARSHGFLPQWRCDAAFGVLDITVGAARAVGRVASLEAALVDAFGAVQVTRCPEESRSELKIFGREPQGLALMRALKHQLDPNGVLNAGANVGGI